MGSILGEKAFPADAFDSEENVIVKGRGAPTEGADVGNGRMLIRAPLLKVVCGYGGYLKTSTLVYPLALIVDRRD